MKASHVQLCGKRSAAGRWGLCWVLWCAACHGSAPADVPRRHAPPEPLDGSVDAMVRELPPSSVAPVGTSLGTPASAEQVTPELSDPLPPSEDATQVDDLVFLVPSAWPKGATVLHIGDSFAGALGGQLNRELARRGVTGVLEFETGTYIATWAARRRLAAPLARHRPSLVLITLGANELDIARPASRADVVRRLVGALEGRPCVWIAPPLWEGAKADVLHVIEANCAPCTYLDSTKLVPNLERLPDKVHPSSAGRARWAKAVITWLDEHPIEGLEPRWVSLEP